MVSPKGRWTSLIRLFLTQYGARVSLQPAWRLIIKGRWLKTARLSCEVKDNGVPKAGVLIVYSECVAHLDGESSKWPSLTLCIDEDWWDVVSRNRAQPEMEVFHGNPHRLWTKDGAVHLPVARGRTILSCRGSRHSTSNDLECMDLCAFGSSIRLGLLPFINQAHSCARVFVFCQIKNFTPALHQSL